MKNLVIYIIILLLISSCTSTKKSSLFKEKVAEKANALYKNSHCNWTAKHFGAVDSCDDKVTVYGYPNKCYKVFFKKSRGNSYIRVGENSKKEIGIGYIRHIDKEKVDKLNERFHCYH
jgi:hypothetical protein